MEERMRALKRFIPIALFFVGAGCSTDTRFTSIEPNTGTFTGGEEVQLKGQNFPRGGVQVRFGVHEAQPVVVESDHVIKVVTPAGDKNTNSDVSIIFDTGQSFILKSGFRYLDSTQQRSTMDNFFKEASGEKKK
jgi:hypothetical protein